MSPRVSVLIQSFNKPTMLAEAVESVLAQTYTDYECIVLEDNSPDPGVLETVTRCWRHPQVSVYKSDVSDENRLKTCRYATMANIGLKLARGEYVTYLCDDDLYKPERLQRMVDRLDQGDCQVVYGSQEIMEGGVVRGVRQAVEVLADAYHKVDHSSVMHTRAAALEVGGWDDDPQHWRWADAVFWRRLNAAGYAFHPIAEVLDVHRDHPHGVTGRMSRGLMPWG